MTDITETEFSSTVLAPFFVSAPEIEAGDTYACPKAVAARATYEAAHRQTTPGTVMVACDDQSQARAVMEHLKAFFTDTPVLKPMLSSQRPDEMRLRGKRNILVAHGPRQPARLLVVLRLTDASTAQPAVEPQRLTDIAKLNKLIHVLSSSTYGGVIDPGLPKLVNVLDPEAEVETLEEAAQWVEEFFAARRAQRQAELDAEKKIEVRLNNGGTFGSFLPNWDKPTTTLTLDPIDGVHKPQPVPPGHVVEESRSDWITSKAFEEQRARDIGLADLAEKGLNLPPLTGPRKWKH